MSYLTDEDPALIIAAGMRSGTYHVNKFGVNLEIDTSTDPEDVWSHGGIWIPPTAARIHDIVSASANDSSAGTGMRTVYVSGLTTDFVFATEIITLNGTTNVPTTTAFIRIDRMYGLTWGSGEVNAGTITATAQTDGTVTAEIPTEGGVNSTEMAIYTVPADKRGYITEYYTYETKTSGAGSSAFVSLCIRDGMEANGGWRTVHRAFVAQDSGVSGFEFYPYIAVSEKFDIKLHVSEVSANDTGVVGGFDVILAPE